MLNHKRHIYDLDADEWQAFTEEKGLPAYRAGQIVHWLHEKNALHAGEMKNLPKALRSQLNDEFIWPGTEESIEQGAGGVEKALFTLGSPGRNHEVETVWLPYEDRQSLCISIQAGCTLDCSFCATGKLQFKGNLSSGQILEQVYRMQRMHERRISNIVFMGMGEPFHNYDATLKAAEMLTSDKGLNISARKITISSSGITPAIDQFFTEKRRFRFALSLHSAISEKRARLMDVEAKYPLAGIQQVLSRHRKSMWDGQLTLEYIMIKNVNMSEIDLKALIEFSRSLRAKVNLIPMNTTYNDMHRPSDKEIAAFTEKLQAAGIVAINRRSPGRDINGACGMLAGRSTG